MGLCRFLKDRVGSSWCSVREEWKLSLYVPPYFSLSSLPKLPCLQPPHLSPLQYHLEIPEVWNPGIDMVLAGYAPVCPCG